MSDVVWRTAEPEDAPVVVAAIEGWWSHAHMVHGVCPQLFQHMGDTCLIVEDGGEMIAFLVGFMSQRRPACGYVHYMGVRPDLRGQGLGRELYRRFAALTRARGRTEVFAEVGTWNVDSIAFHKTVGFELLPGDDVADGTPLFRDTGSRGVDYIEMVWHLDAGDAR
jgi:GNAT superfamily N-acetyltransferase